MVEHFIIVPPLKPLSLGLLEIIQLPLAGSLHGKLDKLQDLCIWWQLENLPGSGAVACHHCQS